MVISDKHVTLFLLLGILLFASFQTLSSEPNEDYPVEAQTIYDVFKFAVRLEKNEFETGEPIHMSIQLVNTGEENVTIIFTTAPIGRYWFWRVYDENQQVVFYYKYCIGLGVLTEMTLQPDQFMQYKYTWNQIDTNTGQQVPPRIYYITTAVSFMYNGEAVRLETRIKIAIKS